MATCLNAWLSACKMTKLVDWNLKRIGQASMSYIIPVNLKKSFNLGLELIVEIFLKQSVIY